MNNLSKRLRDLRFDIFYGLNTKTATSLERLGDHCGWTIKTDELTEGSRVLCAGAGHDISFEKALASRFRCKIVLLDPSPTGIHTVQKEDLSSDALDFRPIALSDVDGTLHFNVPVNSKEGSYYETNQGAQTDIEWPCRSLSSLVRELRWSNIDLLKIDIEGSEYGVLHEIIRKNVVVGQICVEFHYGDNFSANRMSMIATILKLRRAGYDLVHHAHKDHTFINRALLKP